MAFTCRARGTEPHTHEDAEVGRQHYLNDHTFTCGWQYQVRDRWGVERDEDGQEVIRECQGLAWETVDSGSFRCENGHEHFSQEACYNRSIAYASDAGEAKALAQAGVQPLDMQGRTWNL